MSDVAASQEVNDPALALPRLNSLIRVAVLTSQDLESQPDIEGVPSRVESVYRAEAADERHRLIIAAPHFPGNTEELPVGNLCTLTWATPRGLMQLPVAFESSGYLDGLPIWRVTVAGPAVRTERRKYFRVTVRLPVRVDVAPGTGPVGRAVGGAEITLDGHTVDLSEGGLRCMLPSSPLAWGAKLTVRLTVEDAQMDLKARVVWSEPVKGGDDGREECETALRFLETERYADVMRRIVFAEQLRARRLNRDE